MLKCLQDYTQYQMQYSEKHKMLLQNLQHPIKTRSPYGSGASKTAPASVSFSGQIAFPTHQNYPSPVVQLSRPLSALAGSLPPLSSLGGGQTVKSRFGNNFNTDDVAAAVQTGQIFPSTAIVHVDISEGSAEQAVQAILVKPVCVVAQEGGELMVLGLPAFGLVALDEAVSPRRPLVGFYAFAEMTNKALGIYFRAAEDVTVLTDAHQEQIFLDLESASKSGGPRLFEIDQCENDLRQLKNRALQAWAAERERGASSSSSSSSRGGGMTEDLVAASIMSTLKQVV
jgi:hypothetical protein